MRPIVQTVRFDNGREVGLPRRYEEVIDRVQELKRARDTTFPDMMRTAMMMDGGTRAVTAIIGENQDNSKPRDLPIANYVRDAAEAFAGRAGATPTLKVDPPTTGRKSDNSQTRQKAAEKRAMIVSAYDQHGKTLEELMPMLARWVPGAGYAVWTIDPCKKWGFPYPKPNLHSPLETMISGWDSIHPPEDVGFVRRHQVRELASLFPEHRDTLLKLTEDRVSGGVLLGQQTEGTGVDVVTYYDRNGTWWLLPEKRMLLDYIENPLESGPAFEAIAKLNYNRLRGEYDDMIGPMISMARLQILSEVAVRKDVAQPANLFTGPGGALSGDYKMGFSATNIFDANARVEIPQGSAQFQAWQQLDRLERTLRIEGSSPVQDSGESPMSFVTGRGLNALTDRVERGVRELQKLFRAGLQRRDAKLLEYDEMAWPDITKPMAGVREGAQFEGEYRPSRDIKGNYITRREYGAMAAADQGARLNGLAIMDQLEWTSKSWTRTQLDELGIPVTQMESQIRAENAEDALTQFVLTHATQPESPEHLRALRMLREDLPDGAKRDMIDDMLASAEEAEEERQRAMQNQQQAPPPPQDVMAALTGGGGAAPTTMSRVTADGRSQGGTQVISGAGR